MFSLLTVLTFVEMLSNVQSTHIQDLVSPKNYSRDLRPLFEEGTLSVENQLLVTTLGPIDEKDMTFEISFIQQQRWNDPRLVFSNKTLQEITSSAPPGGSIWTPDVYIVNARHVSYLDRYTRTVIQRNGDVFFSQKISARCTCHMDLARYPMDKQVCSLHMESYAFNSHHVLLKWHGDRHPHELDKQKIALTGYELMRLEKTMENASYGNSKFFSFSRLSLHFYVRRTSVYYAYKAFLPTIFLSMFNLGSYFIPDDAMPARVTLIITTFLANMLILQSVSDQTIKVSYTTAMQLFLLINLLFLMASIVQYLTLLYLKNRSAKKRSQVSQSLEKERKARSKQTESTLTLEEKLLSNGTLPGSNGNDVLDFSMHFQIMEKALLSSNKDKIHILDRVFRVIMPFLYLLFCTVYFGYYLN